MMTTKDSQEKRTKEHWNSTNDKCDTIEGAIIIKGERYVTSEVLDSFEDLCDSVRREWLLKPMSHEHLDRPCEGAWWGQREALALLRKTAITEIDMLAASNTMDEILRGTRGNKKKRKPLKACYYDIEGVITYVLYTYKEENDTYHDTLRDPQGRLQHNSGVLPDPQPNGGAALPMCNSHAQRSTH
jgi:hypothetical protein